MKKLILLFCLITSSLHAEGDWNILFDGSTLEGWKSNEEAPGVFNITEDGVLEVRGGRAHLFWMGTDKIPGEFVDFEWYGEIKTSPNANSGIFFHTKYQEDGWPEWGLEAQVNTSHKGPSKTGSIWGKQNLAVSPVADNQWFKYSIKVVGKTVTIRLNGKIVNEYTEPDTPEVSEKRPHVRLGKGTFALQGHDPGCIVHFRNIRVRSL
ncbi:MAG: DUF1080 domain-containing protein [Verrucomicrobiota bacterium]